MQNRIYIRADGNAEIGSGHLIRCYALACMLQDEFDITFICNSIHEQIKFEILSKNFKIIQISDESKFLDLLDVNDIVVIDGYSFGTEYERNIKSKGCRLVTLDDLHNREFFSDVIINHAPGITKEQYQGQTYTKYALGLEYVLLRPAFLEQAKLERKIKKIESVLICFGGSDIKNLTESTLNVVAKFEKFKRINIVIGPSYINADRLESIVQSDSRMKLYKNLNEYQMVDVMQDSELAIVPASGILFEVIAVGCFPFICYYVNNQEYLYSYLIGNYNFPSFGDNSIVFKEDLLKNILNSTELLLNNYNNLLITQIRNSSINIPHLFNVLANKVKSIKSGSLMFLNFIFLDHDKLSEILHWRNNYNVRKWMVNQELIQEDEHLQFIRKLELSTIDFYWYVQKNNKGVGVVYLNFIEDSKSNAEWGIYLSDEYLGTGIGLEIGHAAILMFFDYFHLDNLFGKIKKNNLENLRIQEILGFKQIEENSLEEKEYNMTVLNENEIANINREFKLFKREKLWMRK